VGIFIWQAWMFSHATVVLWIEAALSFGITWFLGITAS
jgi:hypothetical protein